ncbi:MAG: SAF domain-containing protein [Kribbellaceae bacterium]
MNAVCRVVPSRLRASSSGHRSSRVRSRRYTAYEALSADPLLQLSATPSAVRVERSGLRRAPAAGSPATASPGPAPAGCTSGVQQAGRAEPVGPDVLGGEEDVARDFRLSLYVTRDVKAGEKLSADNVRSVRPAGGLPPDAFRSVEGREFRTDAKAGTALTWDLL